MSLLPGYFTNVGEKAKAHLCMSLVSAALLALPPFVEIIIDSSIGCTFRNLVISKVENIFSITKNADANYRLCNSCIPITIITRHKVLEKRIPHGKYHFLESFLVFLFPSFIRML